MNEQPKFVTIGDCINNRSIIHRIIKDDVLNHRNTDVSYVIITKYIKGSGSAPERVRSFDTEKERDAEFNKLSGTLTLG